jgi:hypothetical protein
MRALSWSTKFTIAELPGPVLQEAAREWISGFRRNRAEGLIDLAAGLMISGCSLNADGSVTTRARQQLSFLWFI